MRYVMRFAVVLLVTIAACSAGGPAGDSGAGTDTGPAGCGIGETNCSGGCVDTRSDLAHCGGCGLACAGGEVCSGSRCGVSVKRRETLPTNDSIPTAVALDVGLDVK